MFNTRLSTTTRDAACEPRLQKSRRCSAASVDILDQRSESWKFFLVMFEPIISRTGVAKEDTYNKIQGSGEVCERRSRLLESCRSSFDSQFGNLVKRRSWIVLPLTGTRCASIGGNCSAYGTVSRKCCG